MPVIGSKIESSLTKIVEDINYIAFFSNNARSTDSDTIGSKHELFRKAVTPSVSGNQATMSYSFDSADSCPFSAIDTVTSTSILVLEDASDFEIGDRVQIEKTGNFQKRKITDKDVNEITLDSPLPYTPTAATVVRVLITQRAIIESGNSGANSGTIFQIEDWEYSKLQGVVENGNIKINLGAN